MNGSLPAGSTSPVLYAVDKRVATVTLNRPHRRNAWTGRMHIAYREALHEAERDPAVRAIVVTGATGATVEDPHPEKVAFCVGGDAAALEGHVAKGGYDSGIADEPVMPALDPDAQFLADFAYHFALRKPVIAAINGPAAGVGLVLACFADIRFAVPGAKLTAAHGKLGLPAEYGLSWILPRLIGLSRAAELLVSSRVFLTDEAHEVGLIHQLVPEPNLLDRTYAYVADLISSNASESIAATKQQLYRDLQRDLRTAIEDAQVRLNSMTKNASYRHGVESLVARRPPRFDETFDES